MLRRLLDRTAPAFEQDGGLHRLQPAYQAQEMRSGRIARG